MKRVITILFASLFISLGAFAQNASEARDANARLKALYLYNFARNVDWPSEYKSGNFVIGVVGSTDVYVKLVELYSSKSIGSQPIEIRQFKSTAAIGKCHLLYLPVSQHEKLDEITKGQNKSSSLVVTENDGALVDGAVINFIVIDNKLKYELNKKRAVKRKLIIGQNLLKLAHSVTDG